MLDFYNQILLVSRSFLNSFSYLFSSFLFKEYIKMMIFHMFFFGIYLFGINELTAATVHTLIKIDFIEKIVNYRSFYGSFFQYIFYSLLFLNYTFVFFSVYKVMTVVLISPFLCRLAEKIYIKKTGRDIHSNVSIERMKFIFIRSIRVNFRSFFLEIFINIFLFFIRLVDITFISYIISFFITAYFLGFSYMDFGLELYQKSYRQTKYFTLRYRYMTISVGIVYITCLFVPFLGFFIAPLISLILGVNSVINIVEDEYKNILP